MTNAYLNANEYTQDDDKRWWNTYIALVEKQLNATIAEETGVNA